MKIAFVNDGVYPYASGDALAVGGTERDIWLLSRALAAAGWSATVALRDGLRLGERRRIDGVEYVGIGSGEALMAWHRFLWSEKPDLLFLQGASHLWGLLVEIAKLAGVRTLLSVAFDSEVRPRDALFRRRQLWPLYAWALSRTGAVFVQHGGQLSSLAPRWRRKACILPKVCILPKTGGETFWKPHSMRAKYVAWVAMLRQPKRPDLLVEIARKAPGVRFVACGGPTTFQSAPGYGDRVVDALLAQPNIEYHGKVAPAKAQQVIADAAMLLCTSDGEGFPNTFVQAWSSGTPVVSLKIDPDRLITRKGLGIVAGSLESAVAEIKALMDSPQRRDEIAVRTQCHIADNHSEAAVIKVFESAIRGLRLQAS